MSRKEFTGMFVKRDKPHIVFRFGKALPDLPRLALFVYRDRNHGLEEAIAMVASPNEVLDALSITGPLSPRFGVNLDILVGDGAVFKRNPVFPEGNHDRLSIKASRRPTPPRV